MNEKDLPLEVQHASLEASIENEKAILSSNKELSKNLEEIRKACKKEIREVLGSNYDEYISLRKRIRSRALEMRRLVRPNREGEKIKKEFDRESLAGKRKFITSVGDSVVSVRNIQKKFKAQTTLAVEKALNIVQTPDVDLDPPVLQDTTTPWIYKVPPYYDSSGLVARYHHGTVHYSGQSHYENASTGEMGTRSLIQMREEEEDSTCMSYARSDISVLFQLPVAGLVEVYVYLQCIDSSYNTWMFDEFGFSKMQLYQRNRVFLEEVYPLNTGVPPPRRYQTLLEIYKDDDDEDGSKSGEIAMPGESVYPHLFSTRAYATGELLIMKIGVESLQLAGVNDYECQGMLNSQWFVSKVALKSTAIT